MTWVWVFCSQEAEAIQGRCEALREQLATVEAFDATLAGHLDALRPEPAAAHR